MSIHYGLLSSSKTSSTDLTDLEAKLTKKITKADNTAIFAKSKALEVEQDVTTHSNYITTMKTDILANEKKANKNTQMITTLDTWVATINRKFAYEFSFYYVNIAYNTWHAPQPKVGGYPNPWVFFDTPTDTTKIKLLGHVFDTDSSLDARSRLLMEYKVKILKDDGGNEELKMYYKNILPKKVGGTMFFINEEKTLKELFPSHYKNTHALQVLIKIHETGSLGNESILTGKVYQ